MQSPNSQTGLANRDGGFPFTGVVPSDDTMNADTYAEDQINPIAGFAGIVGQSSALREVLQQVRTQSELGVQSARRKLLSDLTDGVMANLKVNDLLREVTLGIRRVIPSDFALLSLLESESGRVCVTACDMAKDTMLAKEAVDSLGEMFRARVFSTGKPWVGNSEGSDQV